VSPQKSDTAAVAGKVLHERDQAPATPPVGQVDFGSLRRRKPISRVFGLDRGAPIDRYYIERFLETNADGVRGAVLEFGDDTYTKRFGGDRVTRCDVLHASNDRRSATIVADLSDAPQIEDGRFDCIICTQTLQFIFDVRAAIATLHRILRPHGLLLATMAGISQISRYDMDRWGDYWRFTTLSARRLFGEVFSPGDVAVESFGNVLAATAFLHGLAQQELTPDELNATDPDYELVITVRACKGTGSAP
jgi:SAM-dependent methyltransferase